MKSYIKIKNLNIFGSAVSIHWSAILVIAILLISAIKNPILGLITVSSYFGVILLHECGHAFFARKLGYKVYNIYLGVVHGFCEYEEPYNQKDDSIVAWGGVSAQLAVAVPIIILAQFDISNIRGLGPIIFIFGYFSSIIVLMNLAPVSPFDGGRAWRIVPILFAEINEKIDKRKKKKAKNKFKVIK